MTAASLYNFFNKIVKITNNTCSNYTYVPSRGNTAPKYRAFSVVVDLVVLDFHDRNYSTDSSDCSFVFYSKVQYMLQDVTILRFSESRAKQVHPTF